MRTDESGSGRCVVRRGTGARLRCLNCGQRLALGGGVRSAVNGAGKGFLFLSPSSSLRSGAHARWAGLGKQASRRAGQRGRAGGRCRGRRAGQADAGAPGPTVPTARQRWAAPGRRQPLRAQWRPGGRCWGAGRCGLPAAPAPPPRRPPKCWPRRRCTRWQRAPSRPALLVGGRMHGQGGWAAAGRLGGARASSAGGWCARRAPPLP